MDKKPNIADYFKPLDAIVESSMRLENDAGNEEVSVFKRRFLERYLNCEEINPKKKEWKKFYQRPAIDGLELSAKPFYKEIDSEEYTKRDSLFAGIVEIYDGHITLWIEKGLGQQGIRMCQFEKSISERLINEEQVNTIKADNHLDKFGLLAHGAATHSLWFSIPEDMYIDKPFLIRINNNSQSLLMPILIHLSVGKRSSIKIIIDCKSENEQKGQSVITISLNGFLGEFSSLDYLELQGFDENIHLFPNQRFFIETGAKLNYLLVEEGGQLVKRQMEFQLKGENSDATLSGIYHAGESRQFIYNTRQDHLASNTISNLLFKGVLSKNAYALWQGNIFVGDGTHGVDGYQMNRNLLLGENVQAQSIPGLEILTDDVKCSHGVAMSNIDEDQLFYLSSRGIDETTAARLIVGGFIEDGLKRMKDKWLHNYAEKMVGEIGWV